MNIAVTGASGQVGTELSRELTTRGHRVTRLVRPNFTLEAPALPAGVDMVFHAAAWTDVDGCARDPDRANLLNGVAAGQLARLARAQGLGFLHISTNEVFDGSRLPAYRESDEPVPINPYGASKLLGEQLVRDKHPDAIVVRTAWVFGGPRSFPTKIVTAAREARERGERVSVVEDEIGNPTPAATLARRICAVALGAVPRAPLLIHLAGDPPISRFGWAEEILRDADLPPPRPIRLATYRRDSAPPPHAVLDTSLARSLGLGIRWDGRSNGGRSDE